MFSKRKLSTEVTKQKITIFNIANTVIFLILLFSIWYIQVIRNQYYLTLALRNMTKIIDLKAPRGLILDRNHGVIAENKINFTLFLIRENMQNYAKSIQSACYFSGKNEPQLIKIIEKYKRYPAFYMIPIKNNLPLKTVIYIESHEDEFPELKISTEPLRSYPHGKFAAHVLGYLSEITEDELGLEPFKNYRIADLIGRSGVERQYEPDLIGAKGSQMVIKDNLEKVQRIMKTDKPEIGHTLVLTLDQKLQLYVESLFESTDGVAAVLDLETGGLLALVSKPDYNPEVFASTIEPDEWDRLITNPDKPLHNRFLQGTYSPGSVFKIVMALAALQEKVITPASTITCTGATTIYDRVFHCWVAGGHGTVDLYDAIKNSCNCYFYNLGKKLDIDVISRYALMLGLGKTTQIDLPGEKEGLIPSSAWKLKTFNQKWFPGETISVAIGHGSLNVTPAQMLNLIATVALRGRMPKIHLLSQIMKNGQVVKRFTPKFTRVPIAEENFEHVIEGLSRVVNKEGTGRAAHLDGIELCGKTGTSQIIAKENPNYRTLVKERQYKPNSWFVSFAPRRNPKIAVIVLVEHGGDAGGIAAPLAKKIYQKYFENERLNPLL